MKELFTSKKFIVTVTTIIVTVAAKKGLNLDSELINAIVALVVAYLLGQGVADFGKAAAQIKADAPISPDTLNIQNVTTEQTEPKKEK